MATAGTLIADLQPSAGDGDCVQKILADMNISDSPASSAPSQRPLPPPLPAQAPIYQQQVAPSMQQMTMDSHIPSSHMIGNQHPTPADFAAAVGGGTPLAQAHGALMPGIAQQQQVIYTNIPEQKNFYGRLLDEIKIPFIVALLFFAFSLPPIRILIAHYIPSLIKQTGEFQIYGLLAVAGIVGLSFWLLQRVIAPLLSL